MVLKCKAIVSKVLKKSKCAAFKDLKENDIIDFSIEMKAVGRGSRGNTYAPCITCYNIRTKETSKVTFNEIERYLACAEFIQLP